MENLEGNENLIAYCGLYCGDCHGYQQKVPDLARDLRKELRKSKYKKFADFLRFFILIASHRVDNQLIGVLDQETKLIDFR